MNTSDLLEQFERVMDLFSACEYFTKIELNCSIAESLDRRTAYLLASELEKAIQAGYIKHNPIKVLGDRFFFVY